jgi:hypothetical protein
LDHILGVSDLRADRRSNRTVLPDCDTDLSEAGKVSAVQVKRWLVQNREILIKILEEERNDKR